MTQREKEFLDAMWKKAEEKEQNMRLAEELTKTPLNKGVNSFLWDLFQGIGLGQLYAGMGDILSVSFCIAAAFMYIGLRIVGAGLASACSIVFTAAPVLYASVFYLSLVKERQNQTYEQLMSYKYTFLHLMTARMFSNSLIGIGLNLIYAAVLSVRYSADFLRLAATAFASLMIFSLLLAMGIEQGEENRMGGSSGSRLDSGQSCILSDVGCVVRKADGRDSGAFVCCCWCCCGSGSRQAAVGNDRTAVQKGVCRCCKLIMLQKNIKTLLR